MDRDTAKLAVTADIPERLAGIIVYRALLAGVGLRTLRSGDRRWDLVRVRQRIAFEAREGGFSLWQIGRALNRDHSTIRHSIEMERVRLGA
jgi:chromosomal replication initiation ATPase DnaA